MVLDKEQMPVLTMRLARRDEVPQLVALLADDQLGAAREDLSEPLSQAYYDAFDAMAASPDNEMMLAEVEGRIVGCLQLTFIPGLSRLGALRGQIESVRVSAEVRGGGYGRRMFEWAIARCREKGCKTVQLTADKSRADAHRFYGSLGFVASHEGLKLTF